MKAISFILVITLAVACQKKDIHDNSPGGLVASAGPDQYTNAAFDTVWLDGRASFNTNGTPLMYQWRVISGPAGALLPKPNNARTPLVNIKEGTYVIELTVSDANTWGKNDKDTMSAFVFENKAPVARAGNDFVLYWPQTQIEVDGSSTNDYNDGLPSVRWSKISGPSSFLINTPENFRTTISDLTIGNYQFELKATDRFGLEGRDTLSISVQGPVFFADGLQLFNQTYICPWTCVITIPAISQFIPAGKTIRQVWINVPGTSQWIEVKDSATNTDEQNPVYYFVNNDLVIDFSIDYNTDKFHVRIHW